MGALEHALMSQSNLELSALILVLSFTSMTWLAMLEISLGDWGGLSQSGRRKPCSRPVTLMRQVLQRVRSEPEGNRLLASMSHSLGRGSLPTSLVRFLSPNR